MSKRILKMNDIDKIVKFKPSGVKIQKGRMLISVPFLPDFYFKRATLLVAEFENSGSYGLIINKKTDYKICDISTDFNNCHAEVFIGGPVQRSNLFYLHKRGDIIRESQEIIHGVFWGGNYEDIKYFINNGIIKDDEIRFFLGYSGWSKTQLEREITENSWLVANISPEDVFSNNTEYIWKESVKNLGRDYSHWLNFPINPQFN